MKNIFLFLLAFFFSRNLVAQKFELVFSYEGEDHPRSIIQTPDSGYLVCGSTTSFTNGDMDIFLLKIDKSGSGQWLKTYGGANIDFGLSVQLTTDSGFIIAGYTNSFGLGGYDGYLIRTDSTGDTLWTKTFGSTDWNFFNHVEALGDGGFIAGGSTYSPSFGNKDGWLVRTDGNGNLLWQKNYGGSSEDEITCVRSCVNGDFISIGTTQSFGSGMKDIYVLRTSQLGDSLWEKTFGSTMDDEGRYIEETRDTGIIFCASYCGTDSLHDFYVVKTDSLGNEKWHDHYFGSLNSDEPFEIHQTNDDKFVVAGFIQSFGGGKKDFVLGKTGYLGGLDFEYTFGLGEVEICYSVKQTFDHGFVMCGETESYGNFIPNIYLIKTDSAGFSTGNIHYGVDEIPSSLQLNVFPNPASERAFISFSFEKSNASINGFDVLSLDGRIVASSHEKITSGQIVSLDLRNFFNGIYFIRFNSAISSFYKKIIVAHH